MDVSVFWFCFSPVAVRGKGGGVPGRQGSLVCLKGEGGGFSKEVGGLHSFSGRCFGRGGVFFAPRSGIPTELLIPSLPLYFNIASKKVF